MSHEPNSPAEMNDQRGMAGRRKTPGPLAWALVLICAVASIALWFRWLGPSWEQAERNIAWFALSFTIATTLLAWFVLFSGHQSSWRWGVAGSVGLSILSLGIIFRIEHVSGDLVPRFQLRWKASHDRTLELPVASGAADLRTTTDSDFPGFLGPDRSASVRGIGLSPDWKTMPPRLRWRIPIGAGWSGFGIVNGFAVTMEQRGDEELVTCYDVASGELKWSHGLATRHETLLGGVGPRGTPTIHEGRVFALGASGVLRCLEGSDGTLIWQANLLQRIGVTADEDKRAIAWGRAASPCIVGRLVIVPLGGPAKGPYISLAAFDCSSGQLVWSAGRHQAAYSSPRQAVFDGQVQILSVNQDFVSAHHPETGQTLWEYPWPGSSATNANVSQAVPLTGDRVLLSKGYGGGAVLLRIRHVDNGSWQADRLQENSKILRTKFSNVVVRGQYVYGLSDGILQCVRIDDLTRVWRGGRYGQGQVLGVDNLLLVQAESGQVALVAADPGKFDQLGTLDALSGKTWNNPSLFGHQLLVRNGEEAACYELP